MINVLPFLLLLVLGGRIYSGLQTVSLQWDTPLRHPWVSLQWDPGRRRREDGNPSLSVYQAWDLIYGT